MKASVAQVLNGARRFKHDSVLNELQKVDVAEMYLWLRRRHT